MMVGVHGNGVELCEVNCVNTNDLWLPITRKHWFCLFAKENENLWLMLGRPKGQHVRNLLGEAIAIPPSISVNMGQSSCVQIINTESQKHAEAERMTWKPKAVQHMKSSQVPFLMTENDDGNIFPYFTQFLSYFATSVEVCSASNAASGGLNRSTIFCKNQIVIKWQNCFRINPWEQKHFPNLL